MFCEYVRPRSKKIATFLLFVFGVYGNTLYYCQSKYRWPHAKDVGKIFW